MTTIFTRIIDGEIPGSFVHRDDLCVGFLSIAPLAPGHALVVPRAEIEHWIDLPDDLTAHLFAVAQRIGRAQQMAFECDKVGLIIAGYEVPHTHIHVIPTTDMSQMSFDNAASGVPRAELDANAARLAAALDSLP